MKITLRKLKKNDWRYFAEWWRDKELIALTSGDFTPLSDEENQTQVREMTTDKSSVHFMIEAEGKTVGHINLNKIDNKTAELQIVIGEKDYWGQGIGKQAGTQVIQEAKNLSFNKICIEVRPENSRALDLYQKLGFTKIGLKKYPDKPNLPEVIIMEKEI